MKLRHILLVLLALGSLPACSPVLVVGATAGTGAFMVADRRSASRILEDQAIEMKATDSIYRDEKLGKAVHVAVTSYNGIVLLTGQAPSEALRQRVADIVRPLRSVREVYNEIRVGPRPSFDDNAHDAWITAQVKTKLVARRGPFTHVKVVTSNAIVYLMGLSNEQEAREAIDLARSLDEVDDVVALFEYIDAGSSAHEGRVRVISTLPARQPAAVAAPVGRQQAPEEENDMDVLPFTLEPNVQLPDDAPDAQ